ncbi:WD40 repeat-like protein [Cubamyces sp. BRFM 1775]|nr:WD40 repeat-like protein [Cubamyces sp. BRFM 1775]
MHVGPVDRIAAVHSSPFSRKCSQQWKDGLLSCSYFSGKMDRVNVLGSETTGHTGCVNALSWSRTGSVLISSGDDTTVRLWRLDSENTEQDYAFVCDTVIHTGHRANIFNAQMLPHSSRIATVAGDSQIRVFDHEKAPGHPEIAAIRILKCHNGRVKRIVTEDSPDLFLTVAEDGSVRQHDLRVPHTCSSDSCPAPLVQLNHELSTLSLSPLTPYQFVVAGSSPYGYLFDRRHAGRHYREEWGQPPDSDEVTTCVRRFGRLTRGDHERRGLEHITGSRMASSNGHEVLLSYSSDSVYLYSTKDDPQPTSMASAESAILRPNSRQGSRQPQGTSDSDTGVVDEDDLMDQDIDRIRAESTPSPPRTHRPVVDDGSRDDDPDTREDADEEEEDESSELNEGHSDEQYSKLPTIMPRSRYRGACNVETVKDVNFLGPTDEFVVSGSDDGNWFMWEKDTGRLHDILEGDGTVVNVIEGHPYLPLVAVSGIDTTVKLFAPTSGPSRFSRLDKADSIMRRNAEAATSRSELSNLLLYYRLARQMAENGGPGEGVVQCPLQ